MSSFIERYLRRRDLRRYSSRVETGIMPVSRIRSAVAFIDVEDPSFDECKLSLQAFFRENGIKGEIYFLDFRKIGSEERLITSITTTVLRRDLTFYGRPSKEKIDLLSSESPDLLISLLPEATYTHEFMVCCSTARFKIGRLQLPSSPFDLVVSDRPDQPLSQAGSFEAIKTYLAKIK